MERRRSSKRLTPEDLMFNWFSRTWQRIRRFFQCHKEKPPLYVGEVRV